MRVLKKNKNSSSEINKNIDSSKSYPEKTKKIKKKKIGFGKKHKKINNNDKPDFSDIKDQKKKIQNNKNTIEEKDDDSKNDNDFLDDIVSDEKIISNDTVKPEKKEVWSKSKRKAIVKKDMRGKPVFLEDTGEKIGTVFDTIYDGDKNIVGFKIKDNKSDSILSFSLDQFSEDRGGLIFAPSWYTKGIKTIEKLEFKDRISPELTWLLKDRTITEEELYNIFVKHDDIVANYIEDAVALRELLNSRLSILERERITLKEDLMDLTEKRLIKDIDRRKFSEIVMKHRQKVNVLDVNIRKCKELIERLEKTSFGILSRNIISKVEKKENKNHHLEFINKKNSTDYEVIDNSYDDEYQDIKTEYNELQTENQNLKQLLENKTESQFEDKYYNLKQNYKNLQEDYNELKQNFDTSSKDMFKTKYENIKKEFDKLKNDYNKLKESSFANIEISNDEKFKNLTLNYEELLKDYNELNEEHTDLKLAVEKLLQKNDL